MYERPRDEDGNEKPRRGDGPKPKPLAKIVSQFRESNNMTYELDCQGQPLIVRIFHLADGFRIEVRTSNDADAAVAVGTSLEEKNDDANHHPDDFRPSRARRSPPRARW